VAEDRDTRLMLLQTFLSAAVPLRIMEFQNRSWEELKPLALEASQVIAEKGDRILYRGQKKGETAKAVNKLAEGLAIMSFAPGGVKAFGLHFEAKHPEVPCSTE
jgi:hypothetical protein